VSSAASHLIFLTVVNTPVYFLLGRLFFDDWADFLECVRFWFTPDWISLFRGEWGEDRWDTFKLAIFLLLCALTVFSEYRFFYWNADAPLNSLTHPVQH
jgi:hypothetical protein